MVLRLALQIALGKPGAEARCMQEASVFELKEINLEIVFIDQIM
jgi:hypothetical protein